VVQRPGLSNEAEAVRSEVCWYLGYSVEDIISGSHTPRIVRIRHIGVFVASQYTGASHRSIARAFGYSDHTTVAYAVSQVKGRMARDAAFSMRVGSVIKHVLRIQQRQLKMTTEQGENVTTPLNKPSAGQKKDPSTFVLVKEDRMDPGTYGVLSLFATREGPAKAFASAFDTQAVVQYPSRQAGIDDAREYGGVPHTFTAGRELLEIGPPTYLIDPSGMGVGLI
jgi:hypothetical protein